MADNYTQSSFTLRCTAAEWALIEEVFRACDELAEKRLSVPPTAAFLAAFPPTGSDDIWSGFRAMFADPDFPYLGAELHRDPLFDPKTPQGIVCGMTSFQPEAVATMIQHVCRESLKAQPIGFEWSESCSRARSGEFGGGCCAIFADHLEFATTSAWIDEFLTEGGQ